MMTIHVRAWTLRIERARHFGLGCIEISRLTKGALGPILRATLVMAAVAAVKIEDCMQCKSLV